MDVTQTSSSATDLLKAETRALHEAVERTPLAMAMARGTLSEDAYALQLQVWRMLWLPLEILAPRLAPVWQPWMIKSEILGDDLAEVGGPRPVTDELAAVLAKRFPLGRASLFGRLYVLEGSTMGGAFLGPRLAAALSLPPTRTRYHGVYGKRLRARWMQTRDALDRAISPWEIGEAVDGARRTFEQVGEAFSAITVERSGENRQ